MSRVDDLARAWRKARDEATRLLTEEDARRRAHEEADRTATEARQAQRAAWQALVLAIAEEQGGP